MIGVHVANVEPGSCDPTMPLIFGTGRQSTVDLQMMITVFVEVGQTFVQGCADVNVGVVKARWTRGVAKKGDIEKCPGGV